MQLRYHPFRLIAALLLTSSCALMSAQVIKGTVYDATGAVVTGARVMLMNQDYVKLAETKSGDHGEFSFADAKQGLHFVQVKMPMFLLSQQHVVVEPDKTARLHMVLTVARGEDEYDIVSDLQPTTDSRSAQVPEVRAGGRVQGFKRVSGTPPAYPGAAAKRGSSGTVALFGTVKADGTLAGLVPLSSADPDLLKASMDAVGSWRYEPMMLDGIPVETNTTIVFNFRYK
jgi:TonB family protein